MNNLSQSFSENEPHKYWAFISYSHRDAAVATWLHRALESYSVPRVMQGVATRSGSVPKRIYPIFRDREEIPTSSDLGATIRDALQKSKYLIVVCTPHAANSKWVEEEIRGFKAIHGDGHVLGLIVDGEPNASDQPEAASLECFPRAFRHRLGDPGAERVEPVAADIRPGHEPRKMALLRLVAGIVGVDFDALWQRERRRRRQRLAAIAIGVAIVVGVIGVLSLVAYQKSALAMQNASTAQKSREAMEVATQKARESDRLKLLQEYVDDIQGMPALWQHDRVDLIRFRLERWATNATTEDVRGFEWYYWNRMAHSAAATFSNGVRITTMDWSFDGRALWFTDLGGRLRTWNVTSGRVSEPMGTNSKSYFVAAAPDGDRFVIISQPTNANDACSSRLEIIGSTGAVLANAQRSQAQFSCAAFSSDGLRVATGDSFGQVEVWNAKSLNIIINLTRNQFSHRNQLNPRQLLDQHRGFVTGVCFSPDGKTVASVDQHGGFALWDAFSGRNLKRHHQVGHGNALAGVAYSRDGSRIVTRGAAYTFGAGDVSNGYRQLGLGELLVWNRDAAVPPTAIEFPGEAATAPPVEFRRIPILGDVSAAFARNDEVIVTGVGTTVRIESPAGAGTVDIRRGHTSPMIALKVAPGGNMAASADTSGEVATWALHQHPCGNVEVALSVPVRGLVAGTNASRRAELVDVGVNSSSSGKETPSEHKRIILKDGSLEIPVEESRAAFSGLAASPGGRFFTSVEPLSGTVRAWDFRTGKIARKIVIPKEAKSGLTESGGLAFTVRTAAFRGENELVVIGRTLVWSINIDSGTSNCIPNITVGPPPEFHHVDLESSIWVAENSAMCLAFSPDRRLAVIGRGGGDISVLDCSRDWKEIQRLRGHRRGITALCFSNDGRRLISCSGSYVVDGLTDPGLTPGEVKVWDLNTWRECLTLTPRGDHVFSGIVWNEVERKLTVAANGIELRSNRMLNGKLFCWDTQPPDLEKMFQPSTASTSPLDTLAGKTLKFRSMAMARGGGSGFTSIAVHPSGDYLVAVDVAGSLVLWNTRSGELLGTTTIGNYSSWALQFINNGSNIFATCIPMGSAEAYYRIPGLTPVPAPAVEFDQSALNAIIAGMKNRSKDPALDLQVAKTRIAGKAQNERAKFRWERPSRSPDNAWELVSTNVNEMACIYAREVATGELSKEPCAVDPGLRQFAFFPDSEHFATIGNRTEVHIWSVKVPAPK